MTATHSAVSTLINQVLSDPEPAHDDVFRRLLGAGLQDLVDAEAAVTMSPGSSEPSSRTNTRNGRTRERRYLSEISLRRLTHQLTETAETPTPPPDSDRQTTTEIRNRKNTIQRDLTPASQVSWSGVL